MLSKIFTKQEVMEKTKVTNASGKREEENYKQWGTRWAGETGASDTALRSALQAVVCQQKRDQESDEQLQEQARINKRQRITSIEADITAKECEKTTVEDDIENIKRTIALKKQEIMEVQGGGNRNGIARIHFYIGLVISILLAVYLFLFYFSASYSAFIRKDDTLGIGNAIFYPKAFSDALNDSITSLMLCLLMPVIFLGLGFLIHQFASRNRNDLNVFNKIGVWLKMLVLYIVTFIFDALLAYKISEKIYDNEALNIIENVSEYTMSMAFGEEDFWIIIFAGFIAYVIWGLVFDATMEAYSDMTENKNILRKLNSEVIDLNNQINLKKQKILEIENIIVTDRAEIEQIQQDLSNGSFTIDKLRIKQELHNFLHGWLGYMNLMAFPEERLQYAQQSVEDMIEQL